MASHCRVKLLIDTSSSWGRDLIRGISAYARDHGPWTLELEYRGRFEALHLPANWQGNGVIARVTNPRLAREIIDRGLPAVNVSWYTFGMPQIARCTNSETSMGRLMAEYYLQRGFRSFAYIGPSRRDRPGYSDRVEQTFAEVIAARGFSCAVWHERSRKRNERSGVEVARWLAGLPQPVGVAVWGADIGRQVTEACGLNGLLVPDQVAIISAEYDDLMNTLSQPPLTTVDYMADRVGYEAAALLDRMMHNEPPPAEGVVIEPLGIITRQSTETVAVADEFVAAAVRFIRQNLSRAIKVSHLLRDLKLGRRALELRFRKSLGCSIAEEIRRVRLDHAKQMLRDTAEPVSTIAAACGFFHPEVLTRNFKREFGQSPRNFRRQYRLGNC